MKIAAVIALAYFILAGWVIWPMERYGFGLLNALITLLVGVVITLYIRVRRFSKQLADYQNTASSNEDHPSMDQQEASINH
tara:strand:- start:236 stop:478 length:243 start_codon:yes stop_codon:yes gene_type:complete